MKSGGKLKPFGETSSFHFHIATVKTEEDRFLQNAGGFLPNYTAPHTIRQ